MPWPVWCATLNYNRNCPLQQAGKKWRIWTLRPSSLLKRGAALLLAAVLCLTLLAPAALAEGEPAPANAAPTTIGGANTKIGRAHV